MKRAIVAVLAVVAILFAVRRPPAGPAVAVATDAPRTPARHGRSARHAAPAATDGIVVYVVGAVARPGLYRLPNDARIDDAVRLAGGLSAGADAAGVDLAARASDGDEIDVPLVGQTAVGALRANRSRSLRTKKRPHVVDVNDADAAALAQIPGIGPTIAARIVDVRTHDGAFASYDELLDVAGMTQARLDRAQAYLRL